MPAAKLLQVEEIAERCRYRVHSEADPRRIYLCDLLENDGIGSCSCKDWSCRVGPLVKEGKRAYCKHIVACRAHFLNQVLAAMAKAENEPASSRRR